MQNFFNKIKPLKFFLFTAILFELILICLRPPLQSPDEFPHFCRAYQISEGNFLPAVTDQRVGGDLPVCIKEFLSVYLPVTFIREFKVDGNVLASFSSIECSDTSRVFVDFPNTSTYSPIAYFPHSIGLFILRQLTGKIIVQYYGSKFFAFIIYLLCCVFAIRTVPIYKWLMVTLLLLPTNLYMVNSYTGDTMTIALTFMLISLVLKLTFLDKPITTRNLVLLLLIGVLLAFTKVIYTSLLLLLFMIPAQRFQTKLHRYLSIALIISVSFLLANFWSSTVMKYYPTYGNYNKNFAANATIHPTADPRKQMEHLKGNQTHILKVVYSSITHDPKFYLKTYIGQFGTYLDTGLPGWLVIIAYIIIFLTAVFERNPYNISLWNKTIILLTVLFAYSLIILSQHLVWNDVGSEKFPSFQGRYLAPLFPLVFMLFNHPWSRIKLNPAPAVILFVLVVNSVMFYLLHDRFFVECYKSKVAFNCGAEDVTNNGDLKTSDPQILLGGAINRSSKVYRSGGHAIALPPDSSKAAIYSFKDLGWGDLVEIYAWKKGTGGEVVVKGNGLECNPFRFMNKDVQITEKTGWKKIQLVFGMFYDCGSSNVQFYVENPTKDTVYFDDLSYSIKKFR
jgi:uncharacterized membrane protein